MPQTQRYCSGDWNSWDPKITTFPGLYLVSTGVARAAGAVAQAAGLPPLGSIGSCSTPVLRGVNVGLALLCVFIFYQLAAALDPRRTPSQLLAMVS